MPSVMTRKFWEKVDKCGHKNLSKNYCEYVHCGTPLCSGTEVHCLDCGAYISDCGCHCASGESGWSQKRWKNFWDKKRRNKYATI